MLSSQQLRGVDWLQTSSIAQHRQLRCVWLRTRHCVPQQPVDRLLLCRARTTCRLGVGWHNQPFLVPGNLHHARPQLFSQLSHPTLAWEHADASWLDGLYTIGQQADQLVQQQLAGKLFLQSSQHRPVPCRLTELLCTHRCDTCYICCSAGSRLVD